MLPRTMTWLFVCPTALVAVSWYEPASCSLTLKIVNDGSLVLTFEYFFFLQSYLIFFHPYSKIHQEFHEIDHIKTLCRSVLLNGFRCRFHGLRWCLEDLQIHKCQKYIYNHNIQNLGQIFMQSLKIMLRIYICIVLRLLIHCEICKHCITVNQM